jgi:hypothetical protein
MLLTASTANADDKCPPGSWFCVDAEIKIGPTDVPPPAPTVVAPPPAPTVIAPPPAPPPVVYAPAPSPPVVVYTPAPRPMYEPPPPMPIRPPAREHWVSETGLSLRLDAAAIGSSNGSSNSAGMAGAGISLRFRPTPHLGIELAVDALGGTDGNGYHRTELPLSAIGMLYLNPHSVAQIYLLGGLGISSANVDVPNNNGYGGTTTQSYSYFGVIFGGGMEVRATRRMSLNFDVRGFVRGRTDDGASSSPEFTAADGRTTNTSGGALFTAGTTFYF